MLVILSDVHLTDGSSGTTINPEAFQKFGKILLDILGDTPRGERIKEIELVLLGDIFDVIRSNLWLCRENHPLENPIRPWSDPRAKDKLGCTLEDYTERIVTRIICRKNNIEAMGYLKEFQEECQKRKVKVILSYVIGNHDWLINRYPSTRLAIAKFLEMPGWEHYAEHPFPLDKEFPDYGVMIRHGDCYDSLNYDRKQGRDASSIGDALVIDLLNHFPEEVRTRLQLSKRHKLYLQLKEIDNVRPLLEIPAWIKGVCRHFPSDIEHAVHGIWNDLVQQFFQVPFVQDFVRSHRMLGLLLQVALRLTADSSFGGLAKFFAKKTIRRWYQKTDDYKSYALEETALRNDRVKYVVYGHTHTAEQVPLDIVPIKNAAQEPGLEKLYFNSGTWRKVYEHTAFDWLNYEFIGWHVLTFLIFYQNHEKKQDRNYEVWSASLGYGR
jgi:UDP-2,3-diacylglucosamine pyrophosphatase LpxH